MAEKTSVRFVKAFVLIILIMFFLCFAKRCSLGKYYYISNTLGVDINSGTVIESEETHGGFHGDGRTYYAIQMSAENAAQLSHSKQWLPLPMPDDMKENTLEMIKAHDSKTGELDYDKPLIPEIRSGWYYFCDRSTSTSDAYLNYTIAVFDAATNILYYCEVDM